VFNLRHSSNLSMVNRKIDEKKEAEEEEKSKEQIHNKKKRRITREKKNQNVEQFFFFDLLPSTSYKHMNRRGSVCLVMIIKFVLAEEKDRKFSISLCASECVCVCVCARVRFSAERKRRNSKKTSAVVFIFSLVERSFACDVYYTHTHLYFIYLKAEKKT